MVTIPRNKIMQIIEIVEAKKDTLNKVPGKEYYLQYIKELGYRCISYEPVWMLTGWYKNKNLALEAGEYYETI